MTENDKHNVTTGVRDRVVDNTINNVKFQQPELSEEFLSELRAHLYSEKIPNAEVYLELYNKHVGENL